LLVNTTYRPSELIEDCVYGETELVLFPVCTCVSCDVTSDTVPAVTFARNTLELLPIAHVVT